MLAEQGRVSNLSLRVRDTAGLIRDVILNAVRLPYMGEECMLVTSLELGPRTPQAGTP